MTRLPRVLNSDMTERVRIVPQALSATLTELHANVPTALMVVGEHDNVKIRDFVEVYGLNGSLGVYRVTGISNVYGENRECRLTHALCTLQDDVITGQGDMTGTPHEMLSKILGAQTVGHWVLGTVEATENVKEPIAYDNSNAYDSLKTLMGLLPEYTITAEMGAYPWTMNVVHKSTHVKGEGRLTRNIASLRVTEDDSELCTRLCLDGTTRQWDADTVNEWGVVARSFSAGSDLDEGATEAEIEAYINQKANEYLAAHKNPTISIEVDAFDLSERTGMATDTFAPGDMYRLALPDYGTYFDERIVSVAYADLLREPERAAISLNNRVEDATMRMAGLMVSVQTVRKTVEKAVRDTDQTRAGLRAFYDDYVLRDEEWTHIVSEVYVELDAKESKAAVEAIRRELTETTDITTQARIDLDALIGEVDLKASKKEIDSEFSNVKTRLQEAEVNISANKAAIDLLANVEDFNGLERRISQAEIEIDGLEAAIDLLTSVEDFNGLAQRISTAEARIDANEAAITLRATNDELVRVTNRVSNAEARIDANEGAIQLKADIKTTDGLQEEISSVSADLDAANAEIELKVNKNGVIGAINLTEETATIAAKHVNLSGYVTASKLSTELASITDQISTSISTSRISAANAAFTNIEFGGAPLRLRTKGFVTGVTMPTWSTDYIVYMDENMDVVRQRVVTGIYQGSVTSESLVYCGTN